ncbi:hypothetical protein GCM10027514_39210 [Azotobacter armeniacus]
MARLTLERAMPAAWVDDVFEANRQRQCPRELLFSTVVELMSLVSLGLRPSLHATARPMDNLPVSLAALLGFAVAVLACNLQAVLERSVEQTHREQLPEGWEASPYHLAVQVRSRYEGMLVALPVEHWPAWADDSACTLAQRLLALARYIKPSQVATSKRGPKVKKTRDWVDGATARAHLSTACAIKASKGKRP